MHWDGAYKNKYKLCKTVQCWLLLRKYEERAWCSVKINGNAILGNKTYLEAQRSEAGLMGLNGEAAWTRAHKIICPLLVRLGRQMFYRKRHFRTIFSDGKTDSQTWSNITWSNNEDLKHFAVDAHRFTFVDLQCALCQITGESISEDSSGIIIIGLWRRAFIVWTAFRTCSK